MKCRINMRVLRLAEVVLTQQRREKIYILLKYLDMKLIDLPFSFIFPDPIILSMERGEQIFQIAPHGLYYVEMPQASQTLSTA